MKGNRIRLGFKIEILILLPMLLLINGMAAECIIDALNTDWRGAFVTIPMFLCDLIIIAFGFLCPVIMTSRGIWYGVRLIKWEDVCITLLPYEPRIKTKNYRNGYYVIFDTEFVSGKVARKTLWKGRWTMLCKKNILFIIKYYDKPLQVLCEYYRDNDLDGEIRARAELNKIVNEHNAKYKQD